MEGGLKLFELKTNLERANGPWELYVFLIEMHQAEVWLYDREPNLTDHKLVHCAYKAERRLLNSIWDVYHDRMCPAFKVSGIPPWPEALGDKIKYVLRKLHQQYKQIYHPRSAPTNLRGSTFLKML
jgi:hypothetical protein